MSKIDLFCLLFRDASLQLHVPLALYLNSVSFVQLHSRQLINYLETSDVPFMDTLNEVLNYHYMNGKLPQIYVNNGLSV